MPETSMKKQALLIGINQYEILPELKYARQDAEAVEQSLKYNYCFSDDEVMLLTDSRAGLFKPSNRIRILNHLDNLANQDLDLFIFGFWGHGVVRSGKRYLCPLDVSPDEVEQLGVPFDVLMDKLSKIRAKNTCLILDCCQRVHDGERSEEDMFTAVDQAVIENAARDIVLRRKEKEPEFVSNVAILNSCKEGQAAYEWDNRKHGIFTAHLLDAMNRRYDSVAQIVGYVSSNVEKTARELNKKQSPLCRLEGDIPLPVDTKTTPLVTGEVFISYRHSNAALVAPIEEELKKRNISYFIDRVGINYGMEYSDAITQAIADSKLLLLLWTPEVKDSDDIINEVVLALRMKKTVLPYKIGSFNELEHRRLCYHIARLSQYSVLVQTSETITELVNRIQLFLNSSMPIETFTIPQTNTRKNVLKEILEQEENEKRERIDKLQIEVASDYNNKEYDKAIPKLEMILTLDSSIIEAQKLLTRCKLKVEERTKREEERKAKEIQKRGKNAERNHSEQLLFDVNEREHKNRENNNNLPNRRHLITSSSPRDESYYQQELLFPSAIAGERKTDIICGVEFIFRWCPSGKFLMGSPNTEVGRRNNEIQHQIIFTKGFWMMETQVTQKQWKAVMGNNPSYFKGNDLPVEYVSWNDCQEFCKKCAQLDLPVQLPTEAQWEYACRAGSTTAYSWGNALNGDKANCNGNIPLGTDIKGKYLERTTPVRNYAPNAWGLYDMHGNVWEWCQDWYERYPNLHIDNDPVGPSSGSTRNIRGGSWNSRANLCRSSYRYSCTPIFRNNVTGFRCVKCQ